MLRWLTLAKSSNFVPDASTKIFKLPMTLNISALRLWIRGQNGATAGAQWIREAFSDILVLADGSTELVRLNAFQLSDIYYVNHKKPAYITESLSANATQYGYVYITFGRRLYDSEFYLNPTQFRDLELRVTTTPTIGATGFVSGSLQVKVDMLVGDSEDFTATRGIIAPLVRENRRNSANTAYTFTLPPTGLVRRVFLMGKGVSGVIFPDILSSVRMTANDDTLVIYDDGAGFLLEQNANEHYVFEMKETADTSGASEVRYPVTSYRTFVYIPFNYNDAESSYLDLARFRNVRVSVVEGSSSNLDYSLVLERVVSAT